MNTGDSYGKLTVGQRLGKRGHNWLWRCSCECGGSVDVIASNLTSGNTTSCGCHRRNVSREKATKHGLSGTRAYFLWKNVMRRCYESAHAAFADYGGRGITVCERWHDFANFFADMGEKPPGRSLDRIDNSKGYSPDNCRWATQREQTNNMRNNVFATINGKTQTLAEWARETGIPYARLHARKRLGWHDANLLLPKRPKHT